MESRVKGQYNLNGFDSFKKRLSYMDIKSSYTVIKGPKPIQCFYPSMSFDNQKTEILTRLSYSYY